MEKLFSKNLLLKCSLIALCFIIFTSSCTKYYGNATTNGTSNSGSGGGLGALPPFGGTGSGGTGSGSGSSGSGSSGSGTSGGGTGSSGGGTVNPNLPQAYIQPFVFTSQNSSYLTYNDSISLKLDGGYTPVYAGQGTFKYKIGSGATSDPVPTQGFYFLRPYSFYTFLVFKTPEFSSAETILFNDLSAVPTGFSQVRFVSLDPLTRTVPIKYRVQNPVDDYWTNNRTYLDHKSDTTQVAYKSINPGTSNIGFYYRDSLILSFSNIFDAGKKYTIFSGATRYISTSRGQVPDAVYYITRNN